MLPNSRLLLIEKTAYLYTVNGIRLVMDCWFETMDVSTKLSHTFVRSAFVLVV